MVIDEFAKIWFKFFKEYRAHMDAQLAPTLTESQFHVLEYLTSQQKAKPSDLIHYLATTPAAITTLLDRMEKNNLIVRERDESDRRIVWIHMTRRGEEELKRGLEIREQFLRPYFNRISKHNQQLLIYLLGKMINEQDSA